MKFDENKPLSNISVSLPPFSALQLSALAQHSGRSLEEAAVAAIHMAFLQHLEERRVWAMQVLNLYLGEPELDDDLPF